MAFVTHSLTSHFASNIIQNEDTATSNMIKPNYDYIRSEMMTVQHNEGNATLINNTSRKCMGRSINDITGNYDCAPTNKYPQKVYKDNVGENIYSRPIELTHSYAKQIESNPNGSRIDVMTSSCPPATLFRYSDWPWSGPLSANGVQNNSESLTSQLSANCNITHNSSRGGEIYSNHSSSTVTVPSVGLRCSDRPCTAFMANSPPPRPPSLLRRAKPMNTSPHHHHYYHHQRDSGHASIGSSEDLSPAPPLPPRYSSKLCI